MRKSAIAILFILLLSFVSWNYSTEAASHNQLIIINKATNQLAYYNNGNLVRTFSVATGRNPSYTPEGKFKIVNKIVNRPYYKDNIRGGDPRNPLGDRWLGLNARGTHGTTYAIHGNNNSNSIGTYASAGCIRMHNEEVRWLFSQVKINTPVVITNSKQSFNTIAKNNGYTIESKLKNVKVDKVSPQPANTQVKVTANLSTGNNPVYKFSVHDGKKWTTIRDYSSSKTANWKPTKSGKYKIKVDVKNKGSKKSFEDQKIINYTVFQGAKVKSVTANKVSPQPSNSTVTVTATSNSSKNNLYRFQVYDGNKWRTLQGYSSSNKLKWKPTKSGNYKVKVQVKHKQSKKKFDHEKTISYRIFKPATISSISANKGSKQPVNTDIIVTTKSNSSSNNLTKYLIHDGQSWKTLQDYSSNNKLNWKPSKPGSYQIKAQIKHKSSKKKFDQEKSMKFTIYEPSMLKSFSTDQTAPSETNTNIILTAEATKQGEHLFRFSINNGENWTILQDYSLTNQMNWQPATTGSYKLRVEIKHKNSNKKYDDSNTITYEIIDPVIEPEVQQEAKREVEPEVEPDDQREGEREDKPEVEPVD